MGWTGTKTNFALTKRFRTTPRFTCTYSFKILIESIHSRKTNFESYPKLTIPLLFFINRTFVLIFVSISEITMAKTNSTGSSASFATAADNDAYVEVTLDIRDDSVAVHSVEGVDGGHEDLKLSLLVRRTLENETASFRSYLFRNTTTQIK